MNILYEESALRKGSWIIALPFVVFFFLLVCFGYLFHRNILYLFSNLQGVASYLATQALGQNVKIGKVQFNPFREEISLNNIEVQSTSPSLPPLVTMDKLSLKFNLPSLLMGKNFLQSVEKVEIDKLGFHLFCNERGRWELPHPKPTKLPKGVLPSFPIEIRVIDGKFRDSFFSKQEWRMKGRGRITLGKGTTAFLIQGEVNDSPLVIRGENRQGITRLNLALKSLRFSLPQARGIISTSLILQLRGGKVLWEAQANLQDASITHRMLPFGVLNCSFNFLGNQDVCRVSKLKVSTNNGIYFKEGEGVFSLHKPPAIQVEGILEGKASSIVALFKTLEEGKLPKGRGDFPLRVELKVTGELAQPIVEARITVTKAYFRGLSIDNNEVTVRYFKDKLEIREGESHFGGGKLKYRGLVDLRDKGYIFEGEGNNIDFTRIPNNIKQEVKLTLGLEEFPQGKLQTIIFWSKGRKGETPSFEAEALLSQFKYVKVLEENIYIALGYDNGILKIEKLGAEDDKGVFAFAGEVDIKERKIEGDLEGMDLDMGRIAQLFGVEGSKGFAYVRGKIKGTFSEPKFEGGIEVFDIGYGTHDVDHLFCQFEGERERLIVSQLNFTKGMGEGRAQGEISWTTGSIRLQGEVHNLLLSQVFYPDLVEAGVGEGNFVIEGSLQSPRLELQGEAREIIIKDNYVKEASVDLHWKEGRGVIEKGRVLLEEGELDFNGEISQSDVLISIEGKHLSLSQFPFREEGIEGYINLRGQVEGPLGSPLFRGELGGDVNYKGERGRLSAKIYADKRLVEARDISYLLKEGKLLASLSYSFEEGNIRGYLQGDNLPVALVERFSPLASEFEGNLSTNLTIGGNWEKPKLSGMFRCRELSNRYVKLSTLEGDYSLEDNKLYIRDLRGAKEDFVLDGQAELDLLKKDFSLSFEAENLPLSIFTSVLPQFQPEGKGKATVVSKGNFDSPLVSLSFNSPGIKLNGVELENLKLSAEWDSKNLALKEIVLSRGGKEVRGEAELPLETRGGLRKDKPIYIALSWEKQDIGWLKKFTPFLEKLEGEVSGDITVRGTYDDPLASGSIILEKGNMKPNGFEETLKNIKAKLVLQKNRATLEDASFQLGEGEGEMKGNIYMGKEGIKMETALSLRNATIKGHSISGYGERIQGSLNGFLNIAGSIRYPLLLGSLSLSNAKLDLSSYTPPGETKKITYSRRFNPAFLLTVSLGNNCWFISSGSRVLTEGRLSLIGSLSNPRLQGHFSSRSGLVLISSYVFRLKEGAVNVVYLGNVLNLDVFARAETRLQGYKITAYISGPYDNLQLRFASSPPLPQNAILAMFVPEEFAANPEQFLKKELASAFALGLGERVLAPLEFALSEITGLEEISLEYGLEGYPILRLKQSISPKTYIVYSRWLTTPQERYTISLEKNIGGDIYLTFTTDELKRKIWGIEGSTRF